MTTYRPLLSNGAGAGRFAVQSKSESEADIRARRRLTAGLPSPSTSVPLAPGCLGTGNGETALLQPGAGIAQDTRSDSHTFDSERKLMQ